MNKARTPKSKKNNKLQNSKMLQLKIANSKMHRDGPMHTYA